MGGKNVIMIMDDANLDLAVDGCLWGGFGTTGQRCTAASRVVVHEKVYDAFLDRFVGTGDRVKGRVDFILLVGWALTLALSRRGWTVEAGLDTDVSAIRGSTTLFPCPGDGASLAPP